MTLDETPIGDFLELEGPGEWIDETAAPAWFYETGLCAGELWETLFSRLCAPQSGTERHGVRVLRSVLPQPAEHPSQLE